MQIQSIQPNLSYKVPARNYRRMSFRSNNDVIDDGDYVKVSKETYNNYKLGRYFDYTLIGGMLAYIIYKAFSNSGKPPFP